MNHKITIVTLQILIRVSITLNENKTIIDDLQAQMISVATMIYGDSSLFACEIQCTEHDHVLKKIVCDTCLRLGFWKNKKFLANKFNEVLPH